ncbi:hypothetical protein DFH08DRAFT_881379 [Mycena albidolilacea]|uniref:Wax synthase domain-containing protein n=1 Tax=Mycena albidolilacea TaxID=1033008 RepID=A0AAD6ZNV4_9AGAR|nr:hypothetical protein DFH08DRAFT_881379 [Mycena albidolilacea]
MLFILILVHLLSRNSSAASLPHPLNARGSVDSCDDINDCRTLFDIIWGCIATIFACTWVSVHPNVPPPDQSWLALLWRKLKMMLLAIIAPEIMVSFAVRQFLGAQMLSKEFRFSRTHGFLFCMGGFVSSAGYPIVSREQLEDPTLGPEFQAAIRNTNTEDIKDKSKGDALSKGVALVQGLWFTVQCLARLHQRLAVTELEAATLAFAVLIIFMWLFWWHKPLDVQRPITIGPSKVPNAQPIPTFQMNRFQWFAYTLGFASHPEHVQSSTTVPTFWSCPLDSPKYTIQAPSFRITTLVGTIFGAIHCAAWNSHFPTTSEMWMWRSCALLIAAIPAVLSLQIFLILALHGPQSAMRTYMTPFKVKMVSLLQWMERTGIPIYISARLVLIVLTLTGLRFLPPSAFVDISWSMYLPHI